MGGAAVAKFASSSRRKPGSLITVIPAKAGIPLFFKAIRKGRSQLSLE
jgi:hypothetical protein